MADSPSQSEPREARPLQTYTERLADRKTRLAALSARRNRLSYLRLLLTACALLLLWLAIRGQIRAWTISIPVAGFVALVAWHSRIDRAAERLRRAIRFHESGIARLANDWHGKGESGERFLDPHHPYAVDLDLFGRASLFELLSTARTRGGEARLAEWLKAPAPIAELRERHAAIEELRPLLDLREEIAIRGDDFRAGVHPGHLADWSRTPAEPFPLWRRLVAVALALIAAAVLMWWFSTAFIGIDATRALVAVAVVEMAFALPLRRRIGSVVNTVGEPAHDLDLLSQILEILEGQTFHSPRLKALRSAIDVSGRPASRRIAHLRRLMELLDSRDNFLVRIIDAPLLWTFQIAMAIEAWRAENGRYIDGWLNAVSEIEALSALANYAWEHPDDPLPDFTEGAVFEAEQLGHPLLAADRCVRNDVTLTPPLRMLIVSGSNMSGKSTLLRAVGINAVLALAGAPVRARRLTLSHLAVGASIRTMDSLEEGQSRFMAEILRLKQILELPAPALFLLDELLHGTNSHDRAIGAEGLVRALLDRGAIGLATTHDLSLARVADEIAPAARNVHFEDRLENGRLVFDYLMKPGIVTRSNALDLMRAVGLNV
ncbi:MAG: DNA mismatch repair protein MutS [Acidobacteriota bacterium]|nr:DNA mismatch repair protein MutS [Acidobacteriota bacterium]